MVSGSKNVLLAPGGVVPEGLVPPLLWLWKSESVGHRFQISAAAMNLEPIEDPFCRSQFLFCYRLSDTKVRPMYPYILP